MDLIVDCISRVRFFKSLQFRLVGGDCSQPVLNPINGQNKGSPAVHPCHFSGYHRGWTSSPRELIWLSRAPKFHPFFESQAEGLGDPFPGEDAEGKPVYNKQLVPYWRIMAYVYGRVTLLDLSGVRVQTHAGRMIIYSFQLIVIVNLEIVWQVWSTLLIDTFSGCAGQSHTNADFPHARHSGPWQKLRKTEVFPVSSISELRDRARKTSTKGEGVQFICEPWIWHDTTNANYLNRSIKSSVQFLMSSGLLRNTIFRNGGWETGSSALLFSAPPQGKFSEVSGKKIYSVGWTFFWRKSGTYRKTWIRSPPVIEARPK